MPDEDTGRRKLIDEKAVEALMEENREIRSSLERKEFSTSIIALTIIIGFFCLMLLPFLYLFTAQVAVSEVADLIKTISAVLSGIVGSVMGYYFRIVEEKAR